MWQSHTDEIVGASFGAQVEVMILNARGAATATADRRFVRHELQSASRRCTRITGDGAPSAALWRWDLARVQLGSDGIGRQAGQFRQNRPQRLGPRLSLVAILNALGIKLARRARGGVCSAQGRAKRVCMADSFRPRIKFVVGPDGLPLTIADLPPPGTQERWVCQRKALVVAAVRGGLLSLGDACNRYNLTFDDFLYWQTAINQHGLAGLRARYAQTARELAVLSDAGPV
jgi:hypothetical protein